MKKFITVVASAFRAFRYLVGMGLILAGLMLMFISRDLFLSLMTIWFGILLLPEFYDLCRDNGKGQKIVLGLVLLTFAVGYIFSVDAPSKHRSKEITQVREADFLLERAGIIKKLEDLDHISENQLAMSSASKYSTVADDEFKKIYEHALLAYREQQEQLRKEKFTAEKGQLIKRMSSLLKDKEYSQAVDLYNQYQNMGDAKFDALGKKAKEANQEEKERWEQINANIARANQLAKDGEARRKAAESLKVNAWSYCQILIEQSLKAPKSADFPWFNPELVEISGDARFFTINSYVDAQNSFGALIRTKFFCKLEHADGEKDEWTVKKIHMYN